MLIKGAGKNENGLFVRTMPHKRQGVFNYSLDFTSGNIQNFNWLSLWWKGKILITGKSITLHNYYPVLTMFQSRKSVGLALAIPLWDIALCFSWEASDGLKKLWKILLKLDENSIFEALWQWADVWAIETDVQLHSKTLAHCARQKKWNLFIIVCHRPIL